MTKDKLVTYELLKQAEKKYELALRHGESRKEKAALHAFRELHEKDNPQFILALNKLKYFPVSIEEFIDEPEFLNGKGSDPVITVWPSLREKLALMNPDTICGEDPVYETVMAGACHARDTEILMYDGSIKKVQDVIVGDQLMGPDSKPRNVLSLARGRQEMVKFTPTKGYDPFVVNLDHILPLYRIRRTNSKPDFKSGKSYNTRVRDYVGWSKTQRHIHKLQTTGVEFAEKELPIDPYFVGLWLGDGTSRSANITTMDSEIVDYLHKYAINEGLRVSVDDSKKSKASTYRLVLVTRNGNELNPLKEKLSKLDLIQNKHIPFIYKTSSSDQRKLLLAGLVDSDGHCNGSGYEIIQKIETLADDIMFIARSLGFTCNKKVKVIDGTNYYRLFFYGGTKLPVKLRRKQITSEQRNRRHNLLGLKHEVINEDDYFGFELDSDHLYLTSDFVIHHNTGIGKSVRAEITALYQLYCLAAFDWPQEIYNLAKSTFINTVFMSVKPNTAIVTLYKPFRQKFDQIKFFQKYVAYNKLVESELRLDQNLVVKPVTASMESLIGQAIISGVIDEINFYAKVEKSRLAVDGDTYDQAKIVYNTLVDRRKSRFSTQGPSYGSISVSASTKYKGDFTDQRISQILKDGEPGTLIFREKRYEVVPKSRYTGQTFKLLVGTETTPTRIIKEEEVAGIDYPENAHVENIPIEHKPEFQKNPEGALRDICGISSGAIRPFIPQRHKVVQAADKFDKELWSDKDNYVLSVDGYPQIDVSKIDKDKTYYVHVDLSLVGDRTAVAFASIRDEALQLDGESLPYFDIDYLFSLKPDSSNQTDFGEVRRLITSLKLNHGVNIARVSFDGFNSADSMQILRKSGIPSIYVSVDRTTGPYDYLRRCFYEDRITIPNNQLLIDELVTLEYNEESNGNKGKVDHREGNSKDLSDAVCGAIENARTSAKGRSLTGRSGKVSIRLRDPVRMNSSTRRQKTN